jgi:RNA polymerase sigma-70 factor (ECF subfamily)
LKEEKKPPAVSHERGAGRPAPDLTPTLVGRLREGSADAANLLDSLYRQRLIRFSLGYLGNREEAEDVVQDVFCRVLESAKVPEHFRAWIYEICRNRCIDQLRSRGRRPDDQPMPPSDEFVTHVTGPLSRLIKSEREADLWERFASLPPAQREVLLLRYTEGLSRAEISRVLGIPQNLVKHRIYNGLTRLRGHDSLSRES